MGQASTIATASAAHRDPRAHERRLRLQKLFRSIIRASEFPVPRPMNPPYCQPAAAVRATTATDRIVSPLEV
jgi:hypothetical protein